MPKIPTPDLALDAKYLDTPVGNVNEEGSGLLPSSVDKKETDKKDEVPVAAKSTTVDRAILLALINNHPREILLHSEKYGTLLFYARTPNIADILAMREEASKGGGEHLPAKHLIDTISRFLVDEHGNPMLTISDYNALVAAPHDIIQLLYSHILRDEKNKLENVKKS